MDAHPERFRTGSGLLVPDGSPITGDHIEAAKEALIRSRAVHIDSLAERQRAPKVKRVVEPILAGASDPTLADGDEFRLCLDLGLVTLDDGVPGIANPIYREVLIRTLNYGQQLAIPAPEFKWQKDDGDLDMEALFDEFAVFWRENGDLWEQKADYTEVFPHLRLMAFLQRILTTEGRDAGGGAGAKPQPKGRSPGWGVPMAAHGSRARPPSDASASTC